MKFRVNTIVMTKDGNLGTINKVADDGIFVDFGDEEKWISPSDIDEKKTAIVQAISVLDKIIRLFSQRVRKEPIMEEEIILPRTLESPRVEKIPPKPPGYPEELAPPPRPTISLLRELDRFTVKLLSELDLLTTKRAEIAVKIEDLNAKIKELRNILKGVEAEQIKNITMISEHLRKSLEGTEELGYFYGKWRDQLIYIVRYTKSEKVEPPAEVLLEELLKFLKEEVPSAYKKATDKLEKIKAELTETSQQINTYFAEAPLAGVKAGITAQVLRDWFKRFWEWIKGLGRRVLGWFYEITALVEDASEIVSTFDDFIKRLT